MKQLLIISLIIGFFFSVPTFTFSQECPLMVGEQYYKSVIITFVEGYQINFGNCKLRWTKNSIGDHQILNVIKCDTDYIVSIPIVNILYIEKYQWDVLIY